MWPYKSSLSIDWTSLHINNSTKLFLLILTYWRSHDGLCMLKYSESITWILFEPFDRLNPLGEVMKVKAGLFITFIQGKRNILNTEQYANYSTQ